MRLDASVRWHDESYPSNPMSLTTSDIFFTLTYYDGSIIKMVLFVSAPYPWNTPFLNFLTN
jgi:ubiquitin-protein ligase